MKHQTLCAARFVTIGAILMGLVVQSATVSAFAQFAVPDSRIGQEFSTPPRPSPSARVRHHLRGPDSEQAGDSLHRRGGWRAGSGHLAHPRTRRFAPRPRWSSPRCSRRLSWPPTTSSGRTWRISFSSPRADCRCRSTGSNGSERRRWLCAGMPSTPCPGPRTRP